MITTILRAPQTRRLIWVFLLIPLSPLRAAPYVSPWGFRVDLPPGYQIQGGAGDMGVSFRNPQGAVFEIRVAPGTDPEKYLESVLSRLGSGNEIESFMYHSRKAVLAELAFSLGTASPVRRSAYRGWGLCLDRGDGLLLALAYGPAGDRGLDILHLSCLDSIVPTRAEEHYYGPVTEFAWPRGPLREISLFNTQIKALFSEGDAEAAQGLVDREFQVLRFFEKGPQWQEAWRRFYRMIYRDSWERIAHAAFLLERSWAAETLPLETAVLNEQDSAASGGIARAVSPELRLAARALSYVQDFKYERNLIGSDFVNLVSALTEGRGDCDSRALLWALILAQANIGAGIMVSRDYSHAMGIADIEGRGARFPLAGKQYLVAETTTKVDPGLIAQNMSEIPKWMGIVFE
ncbi:MAG: hypothetical protein LBT87_09920 [Treponema sp.]|jgi:hypothetical protein|nr:hypothetical protein [Treponema sp.]